MNIRLESNGGGSVGIRLDHTAVMAELESATQALQALTLPEPDASAYGKNKLNYTDNWLERETNINVLLSEYIQIVQKNIEDTEANVTMLKEQDEAIRRQL